MKTASFGTDNFLLGEKGTLPARTDRKCFVLVGLAEHPWDHTPRGRCAFVVIPPAYAPKMTTLRKQLQLAFDEGDQVEVYTPSGRFFGLMTAFNAKEDRLTIVGDSHPICVSLSAVQAMAVFDWEEGEGRPPKANRRVRACR